ncbi:cellulose biosynthesis protein BcsD [Solimonas sp. SE-A11]|uniref:cellulose biosynthesis protein BcsD n=1 Tax=Solimonas sp. SE-A11 TaxID=3054954 RepID=UPI00259CD3E9|nr:cellulose biosynthesis protein BcsD [Solimonas sp. SE-A11]
MALDNRSEEYFRNTPRPQAALAVLRTLAVELAQQVPTEQLRALVYLAGRRIASEQAAVDLKTLADFEVFAQKTLARLDFGWVRVEENAAGVDFVHGCSPLPGLFGADSGHWAPGLLEGMYAEWMRQLGAGDQLDVREVASPPGSDLIRFRLAHAANFGG